MKHISAVSVALAAFAAIVVIEFGLGESATTAFAQAQLARAKETPRFQVDPEWPKLPAKWVFGQVSSVSIDERNHAWILQRPTSVRDDQKSMIAPPVLEFDEAGNFVQGWGGPGEGYDWPEIEHGIYVDPKGFVWIGGNGNSRVIVFDADTGAFKRMWGAFGKEPVDVIPSKPVPVPESRRIPAKEATGPGPGQFERPVHAARVSNDGLVYVSDRGGKRVQVFTLDGKYLSQVFIDRWCEAPHCGNGQTVASTAFSQDPEQRFLYVASRSPARVWVLDRKTLELLDSFGRPGVAPGEFYVLHHMNVDAQGNLYTTEVQDGKRAQKFVFKGLVPAPSK